jgi:predicted nucleic acid-binding protein
MNGHDRNVKNRSMSARDDVQVSIMERYRIQSILSFDASFDRWPGLKRIHPI